MWLLERRKHFWAYSSYFLLSGDFWWCLFYLLNTHSIHSFLFVWWGEMEQSFCTVPHLPKWILWFATIFSCPQDLSSYKPEGNMLVLKTSKWLVYNEFPMLRHFFSYFHWIIWFCFIAVTSVGNFSFICVIVFVIFVSTIRLYLHESKKCLF